MSTEELEKLEQKKNNDILNTLQNIQKNHSYEIITLEENHAKIKLQGKHCEIVGDHKLIYDGAIFNAANFCAISAINQENFSLIHTSIDFLSPAQEHDEIIFEANSLTNSSGKKHVEVLAFVKDILILKGEFITVKYNENIGNNPAVS